MCETFLSQLKLSLLPSPQSTEQISSSPSGSVAFTDKVAVKLVVFIFQSSINGGLSGVIVMFFTFMNGYAACCDE